MAGSAYNMSSETYGEKMAGNQGKKMMNSIEQTLARPKTNGKALLSVGFK
jgi:hypothetical protein